MTDAQRAADDARAAEEAAQEAERQAEIERARREGEERGIELARRFADLDARSPSGVASAEGAATASPTEVRGSVAAETLPPQPVTPDVADAARDTSTGLMLERMRADERATPLDGVRFASPAARREAESRGYRAEDFESRTPSNDRGFTIMDVRRLTGEVAAGRATPARSPTAVSGTVRQQGDAPTPVPRARFGSGRDPAKGGNEQWIDERDMLGETTDVESMDFHVLRRMEQTGWEHSAVMDEDGTVLSAGTVQSENEVDVGERAWRAMRDAARRVVMTHSHPIDTALSLADIHSLTWAPGMHEVRAGTPQGEVWSARRGENFDIADLDLYLDEIEMVVGEAIRDASFGNTAVQNLSDDRAESAISKGVYYGLVDAGVLDGSGSDVDETRVETYGYERLRDVIREQLGQELRAWIADARDAGRPDRAGDEGATFRTESGSPRRSRADGADQVASGAARRNPAGATPDAEGIRRTSGGRVSVRGRELDAVATYGENTDRPIYEIDDPDAFVDAIRQAKVDLGAAGAQVTAYEAGDYASMRTFVFDDGASGFALDGDDLVSVFSVPRRTPSGAVKRMVPVAVDQGARRLDGFDTFLPKVYSRAGFKAVARLPFDREYAPPGWDYDAMSEFNDGEPDVVFMVYDPANASADTDNRVDDYDAGIEAQRDALGAETGGFAAFGLPRAGGREETIERSERARRRRIIDELTADLGGMRDRANGSPAVDPDAPVDDAMAERLKLDRLYEVEPNAVVTAGAAQRMRDANLDGRRLARLFDAPDSLRDVPGGKRTARRELRKRFSGGVEVVALIRPRVGRTGFELVDVIRSDGQNGPVDMTSTRDRMERDGMFRAVDAANARWLDTRAIEGTPGLRDTARRLYHDAPAAARSWGRQLEQAVANQLAPLRDKEMSHFGFLPDGMDSVYKMAEIALNDTGRVDTLMHSGAAAFDQNGAFGPKEGTLGLVPMLEKLGNGDAVLDWMHWMAARRSDALKRKGVVVPMTDADIRVGLAKRNSLFDEVAADWKRHNDANLDFAVDAGLISREAAEGMKADETYIPFYRADITVDGKELDPALEGAKYRPGRSISANDTGIKSLKGGDRRALANLVQNMVVNSRSLVARSMRNRAADRAANLLEMTGDGRVVPEARKPRGGVKAGAIPFYRDGKQMRVVVKDKALALALAGLQPQQLDVITEFMSKVGAVFRQGITLAPGFIVANLIRGAVSTNILTGGNLGRLNNTMTGITASLKDAPSAQAFRAQSGMGDFRFGGMDVFDDSNDLLMSLGVAPRTFGWRFRRLVNHVEKIGTATEVADRIALRENLIAQGVRPDEASYQALNVINYGRRGTNAALNVMIPLVPFLNARIQGLNRLTETSSGVPIQKDMETLRGIALRGSVLAAASALLWGAANDDEESRRRYEAEPLHRRLNYHIMYLGDTKLLIPKAFEIGVLFGSIPELMLDGAVKGETDEIMPALGQTLLNTFSFNPVPAAMLPLLEVQANYDSFTGRPIEGQRLLGMAREDRTAYDTTTLAREISESWLGDVTSLSPVETQHLLDGYTGVYGNVLAGGLDYLLGSAGYMPERPLGVFGDTPVLSSVAQNAFGRFVREADVDAANRHVSDFYDLRAAVGRIVSSARNARLRGDVDRYQELLAQAPAAQAAARMLNSAGRDMSDITSEIRRIHNDETMSGSRKTALLKPLIRRRNRLAHQIAQQARRLEDTQGLRFSSVE